jgi:hypothetical protein
VFGEVSTNITILRFPRTKRINTLKAFPLKYHSNESGVRVDLLRCGQKFVSLRGAYHYYYHNTAFFIYKGNLVKFPINS